MDNLKRDTNIFRVFKTVRSSWDAISEFDTSGMSDEEYSAWKAEQARFMFNNEDVRERFVSEFEDYLFSCEWTTSAVVREIVGYVKAGTPFTDIGNLVGLKNSAFRMRVFRLTETLNGVLFGGHSCPEGVYNLTDATEIKKCLTRLRLAREPIVVNEEFSLRQLGWLQAHVEGADEFVSTRENMNNYFQAVLYLALTSRTFMLNLLDDIDRSAMSYALKDLKAEGMNSTKLLFSMLLKELSSSSVACKEELAKAKRDYQSFMRG